MAALLVMLGVLAVLLTVAMPTWRQMVQREKEEELIWRGQQYVRAIGLFQRKFAAAFPPDIDTLLNQRFLRKKYKDPMSEDGEFQVLYQMSAQMPGQTGRGGQPTTAGGRGGTGSGTSSFGFSSAGAPGQGGSRGTLGPRGGMIGVASKSTDTSIRLYNGRNHYNEWQFVYLAAMMPGGRGMGMPGMPGMRGGPAGRGMQGPGGTTFGPMGPGGMGPGGMGGRGRSITIGPDGVPRGPDGQPIDPNQFRRGGRGPGR